MSLINREALIEAMCKECVGTPCMGHEYASGTCNLLDIINAQPEVKAFSTGEELKGQKIYRFRISYDTKRYSYHQPVTRTYSVLAETVDQVLRKIGTNATITIEERDGVKTDRLRMGRVAFHTREEAEEALQKLKLKKRLE